jgi:hypothetical protein
MAVWDELKVVLARLQDEQPEALRQWPSPEVDEGRQPPFEIRLAPWATEIAEDLHGRFGDDVRVIVGALAYPLESRPRRRAPAAGPAAELLDPRQVEAELDGPAVVRSGQTLHHGLMITNHTSQQLQIATNGVVTAVVVDPATGEVVGGYAGFQTLPLVWFRASPGATQRIPLLIGTASSAPRLGYAIPPGAWGIQVTLKLGDYPSNHCYRRTPVLPLTVIA